jgi:hypothetical protein
MRTSITMLVASAALAFGCQKLDTGLPGFVCHATNVLGDYGGSSVVAETWSQRSAMSMPRWRVCYRHSNASTQDILLTIESEFQESEPGYPILMFTNGSHTIRDANGTYIYSLSTRSFETNSYPADVYTGDIKTDAKTTEPLGPANGG